MEFFLGLLNWLNLIGSQFFFCQRMILFQYWYSGGSNAIIIHSLSWDSVNIYQAFRYSSGHTESKSHLQMTEETTLVVSLSGVKLLLNPWEDFDARQHLVYLPLLIILFLPSQQGRKAATP